MTLREKIARTIVATYNTSPHVVDRQVCSWDDLNEMQQALAFDMADAVLKTIRENTYIDRYWY